jgi:hypothetical protein
MGSPNHIKDDDEGIQDEDAKKILYRLDERTLRIDGQLDRMDDRTNRLDIRVSRVESQAEENKSNLRRNSTIINAITFGLGTTVAALWAKLQGLINF